jgi:ATP-binding cassette, subfamily B, bacterial CvaB/MchF/RaxB
MTGLDLGFFSGARIKLVRQTEVAECGLAALAMIANFHGLDIDLGALRRRYSPSMRGAPLKSLIGMADGLGLTPRPVKLPLEGLANLHLPVILHWDMSHYVVLEQVKGNKALIHDPAGHSQWMPMATVSNHFTGVALELRPSDNFEVGDQRERLKLSQLWRRMTGIKRAMAQTLALSLVLQAFVLASPYYMQIAVDNVIPAQDHDLLTMLSVGFGLFTLINLATSILRSFVLLNAGTSMGFGISSNIVRRLFRLPVDWFEKRHVGDILSRFQSIAPIQSMLTTGAVASLLDGGMAVFTLALMFFYSPILSFIALIAFAFYLIVRIITFPIQRVAQEASIVTSAKVQSVMIESLRGITTLRLFGKETERHALWQTRSVDAINTSIGLSRIGIWQGAANAIIFGLEGIVTTWLAIGFVIDGGFSIGMVYAYLAYKGQFLGRAASLVDQAIAFRMLGLHLERLSDIALTEEDRSFAAPAHSRAEFSGGIELRNIRYRYSPTDPLVLDGINLKVEPGDHIAITGPSGGGKSTLVKIILGLVEPEEGDVLIDGKPLMQFGFASYREGVAAVLQDDHLFAGTLADNIALFDDAPEMDRIIDAAKAAAIHADIEKMPMHYETLVGDMGSTLSGGQKQRVLLARALYRRPKLLVMDEGTSHLDAQNEAEVSAAIAELGITRIIIAHRAETVKVANQVYLLDNAGLQHFLLPPPPSFMIYFQSRRRVGNLFVL